MITIDTLYYFIKATSGYRDFYLCLIDAMSGLSDMPFHGLQNLGQSGGFIWFRASDDEIDLYRIGFKDPDKNINVNNIWIQFEGTALYKYGAIKLSDKVNQFIEGLNIVIKSTHINRIDLASFVNRDYSWVTYDYFTTKMRKACTVKSFENNGVLETIYIGTGGLRLRMYNKLLELQKKQLLQKSYYLLQFMGYENMPEHLWNIEYQFSRTELNRYKIDSLDQLFLNIEKLYSSALSRIKLHDRISFDLSSQNQRKKHRNEIELDIHWKKNMIAKINPEKMKVYEYTEKTMITNILRELAKYNNLNKTTPITVVDLVQKLIELLDPDVINQYLQEIDDNQYIPVYYEDTYGNLVWETIEQMSENLKKVTVSRQKKDYLRKIDL